MGFVLFYGKMDVFLLVRLKLSFYLYFDIDGKRFVWLGYYRFVLINKIG